MRFNQNDNHNSLSKPQQFQLFGLDATVRILNGVVAALFLILLLLVNFQIVCRFILQVSVPWTEEISRLFFVYLAYLGATLAYHDDSMIAIDTLPTMLGRHAFLLKPVIAVVTLFVVAFMFYASIPLVCSTWNTSLSTVEWISNGWAYLAMTLSFLLMLLSSLARLVQWIVRRGVLS